MTAHEIVQDIEGGLMAEQRAPAERPLGHVTPLSDARTITGDDHTNHHLEKTNTRSSKTPTITGEKVEQQVEGEEPVDESGLLSGARLYLVFLSLMLAVLMFALDQSIVAAAIPVLVSDFNAFAQVPWVITGYFLTQCGLILLVGQLLTIIKAKHVLLGAIFFFELGSLICAVAQSMPILIFGRAVQGIGASGMFVSILAVIAVITRVDQRAGFMSAFGPEAYHKDDWITRARTYPNDQSSVDLQLHLQHLMLTVSIVFVISSVVGPLLGGVFTERVSWRWCFWINLPFGAVAAAAVIFLLPARDPTKQEGQRVGWRALGQMDYIGSGLILACITCLLLALQWGGNDYPWSNWRIILLFVLGALLVPVFGFWEWYIDKKALIPLSIFKNRTQIGASIFMFCLMSAMLGGTYQLPLYYQAGRNHSPEQSGIDIIPFMLAVCIGIFVSGGFVAKFGHYYPWLVGGPPIAAVGLGLLYTITSTTPNARIIGFQIIGGFGIGLCFQNGLLAIQAEYADRPALLPQATGAVTFSQLTGAALGIGIVNTVQSIFLNQEIRARAPDVPFELVRQSTKAIYQLPKEQQQAVIDAYIVAITKSLIPIIAAIGLGWIGALFVRRHNMTKRGVKPGAMAA